MGIKNSLERIRARPDKNKQVLANTEFAKSEELPGFKENPAFLNRDLDSPCFIFASVRSGSTLLSSIMNAHSDIYSPSETQFSALYASYPTKIARSVARGMYDLGLSEKSAKYLLWDSILAKALDHSSKKILVEKTPANVLHWKEIAECWPRARVIFLIRHPLSVAQSWQVAKKCSAPDSYRKALQYANAIEKARANMKHDSMLIRYEDLTDSPEESIQKVCSFLGVKFEPSMLDYGSSKYNQTEKLIGDRSEKMKTGTIQRGKPLPPSEDVPIELQKISRAWGYMQ